VDEEKLAMPVFGKREPADKRGLYERIRGPSKEEVETAVRENVRGFFSLPLIREGAMLTRLH